MIEDRRLRSAIRRLQFALAADDLRRALAKLEVKYRLDQARWPAGTQRSGKVASGRFADEGRAAARRALTSAALRAGGRAALANPEAAAVAAATVGTLAGSTALAVTRGTGWYDRTGGGGATPFLGQPLSLMDGVGANQSPRSSDRIWNQCEADWLRDRTTCEDYASENIHPDSEKRFLAECYANASQRLADCMRNKGRTSNLPLIPFGWRKN